MMIKKRPLTFSNAINEAIHQSIKKDNNVVVFGEGVQDPSSMWGTTRDINKTFGNKNTYEMPTSENALIGAAIGASMFGFRSIVCLNRVEFAMYAFEQIFNNAAKTSFLTNGKHKVPIVIRLAIGRGWGQGPSHSQSMESVFSYFPGIKVVMPLMPNDAKSLLISSIFDNNPVIFLEHRWLYDIKEDVNKNFNKSKLDSFKKISDGKNLTIVSSGFSSLECLKISKFLKKYGITVDNFNFQVFKPLNIKPIISSLKKTGLLLTLDTGHTMYGISSELISSIVSHDIKLLKKNPIRLGLPDIPTPSSRGYVKDYYPNSKNIINSITNLLGLNQSKSIEILKSFEKEFNTMNYDVPNNHFKGPF